jgi:hypothetical protein
MANEFLFLPGERVLQIVGMPGPDTDDCTIIEDNGGERVLIEFQVYGSGPVHRGSVPRTAIMWNRGSETSKRFHKWKASQQPPTA